MKIFDIEADALLYEASKIHVISIFDGETGDINSYFDQKRVGKYESAGSIDHAIEQLTTSGERYIGHNICGYDYPLMRKLYPDVDEALPPLLHYQSSSPGFLVTDTMTLSNILYPRNYEHGLDYWAKKLNMVKPVQDQWHTLDESMIHRNREDVRINVKLHLHMLKRLEKYKEAAPDTHWFEAINTEQYVLQIHAQQVITGVRYDTLKAVALEKELRGEEQKLRDYIVPRAPKHVEPICKSTPVNKPYTKAGKFSAPVLNHFPSEKEAIEANIRGPFSRIKIEPLNMDSDQQLKDFMLKLGWKPLEWNKSKKTKEVTSPKLTEESFDSLPSGLGQQIAKYKKITHRRGLIINRKGEEKGALYLLRPDGRVSAEAHVCGTPTTRYRHTGAVCNIPRITTLYGDTIRSLYCVPDEWWMLGGDLKGIDIRMIGHYAYPYPGGKEMCEEILAGDFHGNNADFWSVPRDDAKSGLFALCYGCTPPTLAATLKKPLSEGNYLYRTFWEKRRPIKMLVDDLERSFKAKGYLKGLDGRRVSVSRKGIELNRIAQTGAAIVFKVWMYYNHNKIYEHKMQHVIKQLIAYHDELQYESRNNSRIMAEYFADIFGKNATQVGVDLKLNMPMAADFKIGKNWAECH